MKVTPIPDNELFDGHTVETIKAPPGRDDISDAPAQVTIVDGVPIYRFRVEVEPDDLPRLAAGEPIWFSMWGHVVPFDVKLTEPVVATMPLRTVLAAYRPGSYDWTWRQEFADVIDRFGGQLSQMRHSIEENGIEVPILLGDDGRVWDGHKRLTLANLLGLDDVPIEFGTGGNERPRLLESLIAEQRRDPRLNGTDYKDPDHRWLVEQLRELQQVALERVSESEPA